MSFLIDNRPAWLDAGIGLALGAIGQAIILVGLESGPLSGPVLDLLMPGLLGLLVGVLAPKGVALGGLAVGVVLAYQLAPLAGGPPGEPIPVALSVGASGVGFAIGWGIRQSQVPYMPSPKLSPADRTRLETDLNSQLRQIDPTAPGAFEQASVLLRQVNEQLSMYGPWGPWPVSDKRPPETPTELLRIQAEVLEAARQSAIAAGASRVTVTATGSGIDIQAIWGEPPLVDTTALRPADPDE